MSRGSQIADEIMEEYKMKKFYENKKNKIKSKSINTSINNNESTYTKQEAEKKERLEIGDKAIFTGHEYNLAKIYNYANKFNNKELIIENILRCPCEDNRNDKIKFKGIDGYYRSIFFDKEGK